MLVQPSREMSPYVTGEITNFLFPFGKRPRPAELPLPEAGNDLSAFDVQRGRDHGLPGYAAYRQLCGLPPVRSLEPADRPAEIAFHNWESLARLYRRVEDIDLMTGALMERSASGGLTGPLLACLMGRQFGSLMKGDRFFYTHGGEQKSFTANQLAAIRKPHQMILNLKFFFSSVQTSYLPQAYFIISHRKENIIPWTKYT
jgi:peroxidase